MSATMETELGRKVSIEDWMGFHRDRLLFTLHQIGSETVFSIQLVTGVTGLGLENARDLLAKMIDEGLVKVEVVATFWKPTALYCLTDSARILIEYSVRD